MSFLASTAIQIILFFIALAIFIVILLIKLTAKAAYNIVFFGLPILTAFLMAFQIVQRVPEINQYTGKSVWSVLAVWAVLTIIFHLLMRITDLSRAFACFLSTVSVVVITDFIFLFVDCSKIQNCIVATILYLAAGGYVILVNLANAYLKSPEKENPTDLIYHILSVILFTASGYMIVHNLMNYVWSNIAATATLTMIEYIAIAGSCAAAIVYQIKRG